MGQRQPLRLCAELGLAPARFERDQLSSGRYGRRHPAQANRSARAHLQHENRSGHQGSRMGHCGVPQNGPHQGVADPIGTYAPCSLLHGYATVCSHCHALRHTASLRPLLHLCICICTAQVLSLGVDVLVCDVDTVWLQVYTHTRHGTGSNDAFQPSRLPRIIPAYLQCVSPPFVRALNLGFGQYTCIVKARIVLGNTGQSSLTP